MANDIIDNTYVCLAVCQCLFDVDQTHRRQHLLTDPDLDFDCRSWQFGVAYSFAPK